LIENKELAVIHIKRRNILKTHLSRLRAVQNDKWVNISGELEENPPITIDYEQCLEDFITTRTSEDKHDHLFQDHPKMVVYYEDLARDYQAVMDQVQSFLGVDHQQLTPETFVQSVQPLSASITNYDELKTRFYGTPWEEFFEE
jgi:LPS sulfotransferase NodH